MARREPSSVAGSSASGGSGLPHRHRQPEATSVDREKAYTPEQFTQPFCDFMRDCPTAFHVVDYAKTKLEAAGFLEVRLSANAGPLHGTKKKSNQTCC